MVQSGRKERSAHVVICISYDSHTLAENVIVISIPFIHLQYTFEQ